MEPPALPDRCDEPQPLPERGEGSVCGGGLSDGVIDRRAGLSDHDGTAALFLRAGISTQEAQDDGHTAGDQTGRE